MRLNAVDGFFNLFIFLSIFQKKKKKPLEIIQNAEDFFFLQSGNLLFIKNFLHF